VQIEPDATDKASRSLLLKNQAVATSGDRYRFVEIDGKRYSHIVDPRTGMGLTSRLTVTVVAENAADADAYASAVSVLGTAKGLKFVESLVGVECQVLDYSEKQRVSNASTGFRFATPTTAAGH
jgi:thiamine biosynthesis lipoprotein